MNKHLNHSLLLLISKAIAQVSEKQLKMTTSATFPPHPSKAIYCVCIQLKKNRRVRTHLTKPKPVHLQSLGRSVRSSNTFFSIPI